MTELGAHLQKGRFAFSSVEEAHVVSQYCREKSCPAGTFLYSKGDDSDAVYFVVAGKVVVQKRTGFGERTQVVALLSDGAPVGEGAIVGDLPRGATVVAVKDSLLLRLSSESFAKLSSEYPEIAIIILKWLMSKTCQRLQKTSDRLAHIL